MWRISKLHKMGDLDRKMCEDDFFNLSQKKFEWKWRINVGTMQNIFWYKKIVKNVGDEKKAHNDRFMIIKTRLWITDSQIKLYQQKGHSLSELEKAEDLWDKIFIPVKYKVIPNY